MKPIPPPFDYKFPFHQFKFQPLPPPTPPPYTQSHTQTFTKTRRDDASEESVGCGSPKSISDRRFKNEKKSSNSESLGFFSESPKDWNDCASIMGKSDENLLCESAENGIDLLSPDTSLALATVASSDLTPLSSITMSDEHEEAIDTTDPSTTMNSETGNLTSVEAELAVKLLNRAIKSRGTNLKTKKVLDALVNLVVEEFIQLPEEKDNFNELVARKANLVVLSFLLWTIAVFAALFFSRSQRSFSGAIPPT